MQIDIFFVVASNLQVVVIIKKGENVNHEDFDYVKKIKPCDVAPMELVGLGSSSSMDSFAS